MSKTMYFVLFLALLVCFLAGNAWAQPQGGTTEPGAEYYGGIWFTTLSGNLAIGGAAATSVDLIGDLGLPNQSPIVLGARWNWGKIHAVDVSYFNFTSSNTRNLTRAITFQGITYGINTPVSSTLGVGSLDGTYHRTLTASSGGKLNAFIGLKILSMRADLSSPVAAPTSTSVSGAVPVIGLDGYAVLSPNSKAYAKIGWISGKGGGTNATLTDLALGVKWNWRPDWVASVDYRNFNVDVRRDNGDTGRITLGGPELKVTYQY